LQSDLDTLRFAEMQRARLTSMMEEIASQDEQVTRLMHLSGFGVVPAVTVWAAIGDIRRFAEPKHLVGYAGLGAKVHDSGMSTRTGRITKAGLHKRRGQSMKLLSPFPYQSPTQKFFPSFRSKFQGRDFNSKIVLI
jgi:transposase